MSYKGSRELVKIDVRLTNLLEQLRSKHNTTLFMLLLAGFNLLLHKLSQQRDLVVGIPSAGQTVLGRSLVGYCINVLSIRSKINTKITFDEYLKSVKELLLDAYEHQSYPFNQLVKKLNVPRDPGRSPLVTVMFNLDRIAGLPQYHNLEAELQQNTTGTAQFDLDLNIVYTGETLEIECDFNTTLFEAQTIKRWLNYFRTLLESVAENSHEKVACISLLNEVERKQIIGDWNQNYIEFPLDRHFIELFEEQVKRTPNTVAASYENEVLTYLELNKQANRLANILISQGVGTNIVIGILTERGLYYLIAMLAIFKSGGVYLPLDPKHPPLRIAQILRQSGINQILSVAQFASHLSQVQSEMVNEKTISVQMIDDLLLKSTTSTNPNLQLFNRAPAYVIYTSGSTGVPKGVVVEQIGLLNHLYAKIVDLKLTKRDIVAQTASQCFDISVWQFLSPLLVGGRVHIFADAIAQDSTRLLAEAVEANVTILETVPALLRAIMKNVELHELNKLRLSLRWLLVTGEALPPDIVNNWFEFFESIPLLNAYGPTECSDDVAHHSIYSSLVPTITTVPIGKPVANIQLYILDESLETVSIGVKGELHVGGIGVGSGYLRQPELTAERFIPDPFTKTTGTRLYTTGDIARYQITGDIEYIGRLDYQVKIRGYRIEIGDIEVALRQCTEVRDTAVVVCKNTSSNIRIIAYVVTNDDEKDVVTRLRVQLREKLPEYMVPALIIKLNQLPVTPSGKIDRSALPPPEELNLNPSHIYVGPGNPIEVKLERIWSEILRVDRIDIHDNFFELGGDSILSIGIVAEAQRQGLRLTVTHLFQYQTISELAEVVSEIKLPPDEKKETLLVSELANYKSLLNNETLTSLKLTDSDIEFVYPLSHTQQGMLFHYLYAPESTAYFEQVSWTLHGALNIKALQQAWEMVIERHSVLRTIFAWGDTVTPLQIVLRKTLIQFVIEDWRDKNDEGKSELINDYLQADRDNGFDLAVPPIRFTLIKLCDDSCYFIWSYHHILLDGWSVMLVLTDVFDLYDELCNDSIINTTPSPPYYRYIQWLQKQELSEAEQFWRRTLSGFTTPTIVGIDQARKNQISGKEDFAVREMILSSDLTEALKTLTRRQQLTMSTIVQGAWALALSFYSGKLDVLYGTVVSGRPVDVESVNEMVGLFINTLPTRVFIEGDLTIVEWLRKLQIEQAMLRQFEHSPLAQIQTWSEIENGIPLFESIVAFENYPINISFEKRRARISASNVRALERVNYPLFFVVGPDTKLSMSIYYDSYRYDSLTIDRMLGHIQNLLEGMIKEADKRLSNISLLTEIERKQLLLEWNDTEITHTWMGCVHQLFVKQAKCKPEAIALSCDADQLSYDELNLRSDRLARYLISLGVTPGSLVAICMKRSVEMVIGILGIWKAGGAYVPIDPLYPGERVEYMLKDLGSCIVLTEKSLLMASPLKTIDRVVTIDDVWESKVDSQAWMQHRLFEQIDGDYPAYVIYTSGSTGAPKGVQITHQSFVNFLYSMQTQLGFTGSEKFLAVTSLSFDIAGLELFLPLLSGARTEITVGEDISDGDSLHAKLQQCGATHLQATPITWEMLVNSGWHNNGQLSVLCGGEAFPFSIIRSLIGDGGSVWNLYGPTETTIWSTMDRIENSESIITIGRPIANTQTYIVNESFQPVPVEVSGALYIGGSGISLGYLGKPELTAERFVPDPFGCVLGGRLYHTGDLASYLPGGKIRFGGRSDHQVKLHGYRIEPAEIEAALVEHPSVRQSVVVIREDSTGDKRLIAYVVFAGTGNHDTDISVVRDYLNKRLPRYMVPTAFLALDTLPKTPNGKIDRKRLPEHQVIRLDHCQEFIAPRTPIEEKLAIVWNEIFDISEISINDNFFELGGDSIKSIQFVSRAKRLGLQYTPTQLFANPTIAELAELVEHYDVAMETSKVSVMDMKDVPLTPVQQWFFELNSPEPNHFNQSVLLEVPQTLDPVLIERAIALLINRHDALRLRFKRDQGAWKQSIVEVGEHLPVVIHDITGQAIEDQNIAIEKLANKLQGSFDLHAGPLLRVALFNLGGDRSARLLIIVHHLAIDIISWFTLMSEFQTIYSSLSEGREIVLPEKTTSFAHWAHALREMAVSKKLLNEADYWLNLPIENQTALPIDIVGENIESSTDILNICLTATETRLLLNDAPRQYLALPSEIILTAVATTLSQWTESKSCWIDLEGHGRESLSSDHNLARTIGWFTVIYPVQLDMGGGNTFIDVLKLVKEQLRSVPGSGLSFNVLKYLGEGDETEYLRKLPCAEVVFNYSGSQIEMNKDPAIRPAKEPIGHLSSPRMPRPYLLMITATVRGEQLALQWSYSRNVHYKESIYKLAHQCVESLRAFLYQEPKSVYNTFTPSDFPNAQLNQSDLDAFIATIDN